MRSCALLVALAAAAAATIGCAGLHLTAIKTAQQRPSNVAVYFRVQNENGEGVPGLSADAFRIYEDGTLVSRFESKQTILNPEVAAVHYTLLLVDMSGSVVRGGSVEALVQAAATFTDRVEKQQRVGVYAFDGTESLYPIAAFTDPPASAKAGVQLLSSFKPKDESTNLNGAIVKALDELDGALSRAAQPMKFGSLVVFTDGTDRAARVTAGEMQARIKSKPFDVFAIGLGAEIRQPQLASIGKSGTAMAANKDAIVKAFDDVGAKLEARAKSYYLLSYCSPARAGKHEVRIEAIFKDPRGKGERAGSLRSEFDATGFGPGCDPNNTPPFDVTKGDTLAPKPKDDDKDKKTEKKETKERKAAAPPKPAAPSAPPPPPSPPPPPPPRPPQDFDP